VYSYSEKRIRAGFDMSDRAIPLSVVFDWYNNASVFFLQAIIPLASDAAKA
jgi:hypothetical protein